MGKMFNMIDNDIIKWEYDGKTYCLHCQRDDYPEDNPRKDWDHESIMACWYGRYRLGDYEAIKGKEPEDFWRQLVRDNVPEAQIFEAAAAGYLAGIRIAKNEEDPELVDVYETSYLQAVVGKGEPEECLEYEGITPDSVAQYLLDDLTIAHCMVLVGPYAVYLPLWLYDHSGISISCGARTYPYNDRWDSTQAGWIVMTKKATMANYVDYVTDDNGDPIRVEHKHEGLPSTWSYKTKPLTDETWQARATEILEDEVETYDQYLRGDVYGYHLYVYNTDDEDWDEADACWGYFGSDILENGAAENLAGDVGLKEAIENGTYEVGHAVQQVYTSYKFEF